MIAHLKSYVRPHRKRLGLTQAELGVLLGGEDQSVIARFEKGTRIPPLGIIFRLSELFDVPPEKLFPCLYNEHFSELLGDIGDLKAKLDQSDLTSRTRNLSVRLGEVLARLPSSLEAE